MTVRFTPPRRRALAVLARHGRARISNATCSAKRTVYWQTANWMVSEGLAELRWGSHLFLTVAGDHFADSILVGAGACP